MSKLQKLRELYKQVEDIGDELKLIQVRIDKVKKEVNVEKESDVLGPMHIKLLRLITESISLHERQAKLSKRGLVICKKYKEEKTTFKT